MLAAQGNKRSLHDLVDQVLQAWLAEAAIDDPETAHEAARGYQWKSLFLPDGTLLRFQYRGEYVEASVVGDAILYQGAPPVVVQVTGTVRKACCTLWIREPDHIRWHLADTRRCIPRATLPPVREQLQSRFFSH